MTTVRTLLDYFKISPNDWDVLVVGDGSGTTWEKEFGWGSVMIERDSFERRPFYGGMSHGTNNMAELMAVFHPLMYMANNDMGVRTGGLRVHVISDSAYVVNGMKAVNPVWASKLKVNRELWMGVHMTKRKGLVIKAHHVPRDKLALNQLGHTLANLCRKTIPTVMAGLEEEVYKANPEDAE